MNRMLVLLFLSLSLMLPEGNALAEEIDTAPVAPNSESLKDPAPVPAVDYVHLGATGAHVTARLPQFEPTSLEMQLRNMTTGELISGWETHLWDRGSWQFNLAPDHSYCYQARSRDIHGDISIWGLAKCATTDSHYYGSLSTPASSHYMAAEIALPDLDGDGRLDFFGAVVDDEDAPTLHLQQAIGTFLDVTPTALLETSKSVIFGDWDNDGDADAYKQDRVFLRNDGAPSFTDLSANLLTVLPPGSWTGRNSQAWVDLDNDGYLELFVTNYTETRALKKSGPTGFVLLAGATLTGLNGIGTIDFSDHDLDGDADLLLVDIDGIHIYENDGAGNLSLINPGANLTLNNAACWGDLDDDGWPDLAISNSIRGVEIAINLHNGTYQKQSGRMVGDPLLPEPNGSSVSSAQGFDWADADNDGDLDLLVQRGAETATVLCRNDGSGVLHAPNDCFYELLCKLELDTDVVTGDLNEDGVLDVFRPGTAIAYGRDGIDTSNGNWVILRLIGTSPSNRMAVGARVRLTVNGNTQYRQLWATAQRGSQNSPFLHFGLGIARFIDSIVIQWPSGETETYSDLQPNHRYTITEGNPVVGVEDPGFASTIAALHPPRPNPFSGHTTLAFDLPRASQVEAVVYDLQGRVVRRLEYREYPAGHHSLSWDSRDGRGQRVAGGVYYMRVRAAEQEMTQRMVLLH